MSPMTKVAVESFWEYVAFALNSAVFLLIGFEVLANDVAARIVRLERRDYDDPADLLISPAPENAREQAPGD